MFDATSRYASVANTLHVAADGRQIAAKKRRLLPRPEAQTIAREAIVAPGERLDLVAARQLGDPLVFWRIADANQALNPFALSEPGARLLIPGPHPARIDNQ